MHKANEFQPTGPNNPLSIGKQACHILNGGWGWLHCGVGVFMHRHMKAIASSIARFNFLYACVAPSLKFSHLSPQNAPD